MSEFKEVTKEEFFKTLYADKRDIMPVIENPYSGKEGYISIWKTNNGGREVFGKSVDKPTKKYYLN